MSAPAGSLAVPGQRHAGSAPPTVDFAKLASQFLGGGAKPAASSGPVAHTFTAADGSWQGSDGNWYNKDGSAKGGAAKTTAPAAGSSGAMPTFTNIAQKDPRLEDLARVAQARLDNPSTSTHRAIDAAGLAIRDLASGHEKEAQVSAAQRGVSGSGMESAALSDIQQNTAGQVAGAARDIALGRERDQDQFILGSAGALGAAGNAARSDRALTQQAWIENEQNARAQQNADFQRQIAILNLLGQYAT